MGNPENQEANGGWCKSLPDPENTRIRRINNQEQNMDIYAEAE